ASLPRLGASLRLLPVVHRALDASMPTDESNFGVVQVAGHYFQIGCVPIVLQGFPIGTLILGDRLDVAFLRRLRQLFGGEIIIARDGEIITTTLAQTPATRSATTEL